MEKTHLIKYFTENNKSGYKTRKNHIIKKFGDLYDIIHSFNEKFFPNNNFELTQKLYNYLYDVKVIPKCENCDNDMHWRGVFTEGYLKYCSKECKNTSKKRIQRMKETCLNKYGVDSVLKNNKILNKKWNTINQKIINRFNQINYQIVESDKNKLKIKHPDGHIFEIDRKIAINRLNAGCEISTTLLPISSLYSTHEIELRKFIDELNVEYYVNDRSIIKPKEIDIYIPKNKIGIEINGLYWHSEFFVNDDYHINKLKHAENNNIDLIQIFEDEWVKKQEIVKSIIRSRLNLINEKIYARKCVVKELNPNISKQFLNENHIQGNVPAKIKLGLYHNDELVSVMTFGGLRKALGGNKNDGDFEMLRFCNKINTIVIGGASKLLNYFLSKYTINKIITYADRRYFNGKLYYQLGFDFIGSTKPNYWYVFKNTIHKEHRFNYRKDVLIRDGYDINKTEREIMLDRKIPRIYDCGNHKYELKT